MTQAFLPLIRKARGRIVYTGSIGGTIATPFIGPYNASKFAMEAVTDALRMELRPWGIQVPIVKPGNIADLMAMPEIDGALVGGASLDPDDFARIVRFRA